MYVTYNAISQHKHFVHYTSTFRSKCSVPSVAVSCRTLMSCCGIFRYPIIILIFTAILIPVPSRSNSWVCGLHLLGLQIRISPGACMSVYFECCVVRLRYLSRAGHTPRELYRVWCVWDYRLPSDYRRPIATTKNPGMPLKYRFDFLWIWSENFHS